MIDLTPRPPLHKRGGNRLLNDRADAPLLWRGDGGEVKKEHAQNVLARGKIP